MLFLQETVIVYEVYERMKTTVLTSVKFNLQWILLNYFLSQDTSYFYSLVSNDYLTFRFHKNLYFLLAENNREPFQNNILFLNKMHHDFRYFLWRRYSTARENTRKAVSNSFIHSCCIWMKEEQKTPKGTFKLIE